MGVDCSAAFRSPNFSLTHSGSRLYKRPANLVTDASFFSFLFFEDVTDEPCPLQCHEPEV